MSKSQEKQGLIHWYKRDTGVKEVDMREVADFAIKHGWPMPEPIDPRDRLAKEFAAAAREETRKDIETGESYRVNHVYTVIREGEQLHLWVDIDEARREPMHASLTMRREQVVGDVTQLTFDAEHWNRINPSEEPIEIEKDFGLDVEIRRNARGLEPA
ncbi:MAG: hypothetical protein ACR2NS_06500 [Gemmatimonadaceae bacterium]